jgi:putative membrane protein
MKKQSTIHHKHPTKRIKAKRLSPMISFIAVLVIALVAAGAAYASKSASGFVQTATISGNYEIAASRLALQNSQNDDIKSFAQQMIDDHTAVGDQLKTAVADSNANLTQPTSSLDGKHRHKLDKLGKLTGADFDKEYVSQQVSEHNDAVSLFKDYARHGDNDTLKTFAAQTLPKLEEHQQHIKDIKSDM